MHELKERNGIILQISSLCYSIDESYNRTTAVEIVHFIMLSAFTTRFLCIT